MTEEPKRERETWNNKLDFLLACIGFSVGLGNVWRFPYLCYKNGGGAFLVPYLICVVIGGIPLFFIEVALGQFMSEGGIKAWNLVPVFQGIGFATTVIVFFLNCYYNVILAWAFHYFGSSFTTELPWIKCGNWWNTDACTDFTQKPNVTNVTGLMTTVATTAASMANSSNATIKRLDATTEYWENKVLGISSGIDDVGTIKWDLALCLVGAWIVVYLCICKGIRTSGKVMYVTATSPYIFMTILLIRGCLLDGAIDGIIYYVYPEIEKLRNMQVWVDAGTQIFFSYSISLGALTALGSYNKFKHNSYRDSIIFAAANSGTSIFAGFVIFSVLGHMAKQQGVKVSEVAESGPGLAFIAYPKAVAVMPIAPLWSVFFFLMIILLGLDSQFVGVEGLVTAFQDFFPSLRKTPNREIFVGIMCIIMCGVGLSMVTNAGMYVFQLFDYYSGSRIILLVAFFELVAIAYVYGVNRFYDNLQMMFGFRINPFMKWMWLVASPIFCLTIFIMSAINYSELSYERPSGEYIYPQWAISIGWALACLSAIFIPLVAIVKVLLVCCRGQPWKTLITPEGLKEHQLRPQDFGEQGIFTNMEPQKQDTAYQNKAFEENKM